MCTHDNHLNRFRCRDNFAYGRPINNDHAHSHVRMLPCLYPEVLERFLTERAIVRIVSLVVCAGDDASHGIGPFAYVN